MVFVEDGIFSKTKTAVEKYQNAQEQEEMQIAKYSNEIDNYIGYSRSELGIEVVELIANFNNGTAAFEYPTGFNMNNTYIVSAKTIITSNTPGKSSSWAARGISAGNTSNGDSIILTEDKIYWFLSSDGYTFTQAKILITKIGE